MISLDYSIAYQIVLFLVLWVILSKVLFGPSLNLLDERERRTTGAQHDSSYLEQEGARLRAQYEAKNEQAEADGHVAREEMLQEGRQQRRKLLADEREGATSTQDGVR